MEELMYYVWQQKMFNSVETIDGTELEVLHPGMRNGGAGPDFFNAKIKINGMVWAGNVEMHVKASDWYRHHHDSDRQYDSVILHVVLQADAEIKLHDETVLRTVVMHIPPQVMTQYNQLVGGGMIPGTVPAYNSISCISQLPQIPSIIQHDWMTSLATMRMLGKMQRVKDLISEQHQSWQEAFYVILLRSFGTGVNSDNCERLARSLPYKCLLHHKDDLIQLQALLLGQANLLNIVVGKPEDKERLNQEAMFLRQKFGLRPLPFSCWTLGRVRPQAHPVNRLLSFASLVYKHADLFDEVINAKTVDEVRKVLRAPQLGITTVNSLIINAVVPTLLSYGQWQADESMMDRALDMLEQIPAESNSYITRWVSAGIPVRNAMDTQALLHLYKEFCQPHKCVNCRWGCWVLKNCKTDNK